MSFWSTQNFNSTLPWGHTNTCSSMKKWCGTGKAASTGRCNHFPRLIPYENFTCTQNYTYICLLSLPRLLQPSCNLLGLEQRSCFLSSRTKETFFLARYQCKHFHSGWKKILPHWIAKHSNPKTNITEKEISPQSFTLQFRNWTWSRKCREKITTSLNSISFLKPQKSKSVQNRPQFHSSLLLYT